MNTKKIEIIPITGLPEFKKGDDLIRILNTKYGIDRDIRAIIDRKNGSIVIAQYTEVVENIENESTQILRKRGETVIARTKHGFICANAGIDKSNIEKGYALLLPEDPDKSAYNIRKKIAADYGSEVAVIISDTFGRAWRKGQTNVAIGCSGIEPLASYIGTSDLYGNDLMATEIAIIDELASASELVMNKIDKIPIAIIRGYTYSPSDKGVKEIIRSDDEDFFL